MVTMERRSPDQNRTIGADKILVKYPSNNPPMAVEPQVNWWILITLPRYSSETKVWITTLFRVLNITLDIPTRVIIPTPIVNESDWENIIRFSENPTAPTMNKFIDEFIVAD